MSLDRWIPPAACGFVVYLLLAAPSVGWLDGGELVAAAWDLGVSHPPGQPLPTLLWKLSMLAPVGNVATRATWSCAAWAALATLALGWALRPAIAGLPAALRTVAPWVIAPLALFGFATATQAVRAEVYALQLALGLAVVGAAIACGAETAPVRRRAAVAGAGLLGLSSMTHPLLAVGLVPALAIGWLAAARDRGWRSAPAALGALLAGFSCVLYLPLRSAARPELAWGMPHTPGALLAVLSGKTFAQNFSPSDGSVVGHNVGVVGGVIAEDIGPEGLGIMVVCLGVWVAARSPRAAAVWLAAILGNLATVLFQNKVFASNPDLHGYLALTTVLLAGLAGVGVLRLLAGLTARGWLRRPAPVAGLVAAGLALAMLPGALLADRAGLFGPEQLARGQADGLPPGAVLVTSGNSSAFVHTYLDRVERRRPDLAVFHRILLGHGFYERQLELRAGRPPAGIDTAALRGDLRAADVVPGRVVAVEIREPDLAWADRLRPVGRVMWLGAADAPPDTALADHRARLARWRPADDDPALDLDREGRGLLAYEHLLRGAYFRELGRTGLAQAELEAAQRLEPGAELALPEVADPSWWRGG